jgi:hypothetical protein
VAAVVAVEAGVISAVTVAVMVAIGATAAAVMAVAVITTTEVAVSGPNA